MSKIAALELNSVNVDLVPNKNWREMIARGRKGMSFKIFAHAKDADGNLIAVSTGINALNDAGEVADFGTAEVPAIARLLAKSDAKLDTAKIKYGGDGQPVVDANGQPVYEETVVCEDGTEADLFFGTLFFCPLHSNLRISLLNAELTPSVANGAQRMAKDAAGNATIPIFDAVVDGIKVEKRASAQGLGLRGRVSIGATAGGLSAAAARVTAARVSESAGAESIGM